jgi:hypothetical protein
MTVAMFCRISGGVLGPRRAGRGLFGYTQHTASAESRSAKRELQSCSYRQIGCKDRHGPLRRWAIEWLESNRQSQGRKCTLILPSGAI